MFALIWFDISGGYDIKYWRYWNICNCWQYFTGIFKYIHNSLSTTSSASPFLEKNSQKHQYLTCNRLPQLSMAHSNSGHSINSNPFKLCTRRKAEKSFHILKTVLKFNTATSILNNATFQANILLDSTKLPFGQVNKVYKSHATLLKNVYQSSWYLRKRTAVKNMLHKQRFVEFSYIIVWVHIQ